MVASFAMVRIKEGVLLLAHFKVSSSSSHVAADVAFEIQLAGFFVYGVHVKTFDSLLKMLLNNECMQLLYTCLLYMRLMNTILARARLRVHCNSHT